MNPHIGEDAELYALGALNDAQRRAVDEHVRDCDSCAAQLGQAESAVTAAIVRCVPPRLLDARVRRAFRVPLPWRGIAPLLAACFVLGLLPVFVLLPGRRAATQQHDLAVAALVSSHFAHVAFAPLAPDAPKAKLLYGRAPADWRLIIAQTAHRYTVRGIVDGRETAFGTLQISGTSGEIFVPKSRAREFGLYDGNREVSRAVIPGR